MTHGCIGDQTIIGTKCGREAIIEHHPERMGREFFEPLRFLEFGGETNLDRDASIGNELPEGMDILFARLGSWQINHFGVE